MSVLVETSLGNLTIDLHTDACPLATKNFLKLCKTKYYNNVLVYSVQHDFLMQTGDPTGTGRGGSSIYGALYGDQARFFDDELRPALTHARKGTVGMASVGPGLNGSQVRRRPRVVCLLLLGMHARAHHFVYVCGV